MLSNTVRGVNNLTLMKPNISGVNSNVEHSHILTVYVYVTKRQLTAQTAHNLTEY